MVTLKPQFVAKPEKKENKRSISLASLKKKPVLDNYSPFDIPAYHRPRTGDTGSAFKQGNKVSSDMAHNCFTCLKYSACRDTNKSFNYRCSRYQEAVIEATSLEDLLKQGDDTKIIQESDIDYSLTEESSVVDMIEKVINSNIPVPPDLRIKDDEIPQAKNFWNWISDAKFAKAGQSPFPRQLEFGLKVYGEYCPRCSDMEWFDTMAVDAPLTEIQERVVMLEHGICPKCHITRSELVGNGELNDYYGVIGLAGQRCVVGDTLAMTTHGMKYFNELIHPKYRQGFNDYAHSGTPRKGKYTYLCVGIENGHTAKPSDFYISAPSFTYKVVTREGYHVEGTADHPIMTERGWVKLKDITKTDNILIEGGQNIWSDVDWIDYKTAMLCGYVTSEGHKGASLKGKPNALSITNKNKDILNFCKEQLTVLGYTNAFIRKRSRKINMLMVEGIDNCKGMDYYFGRFGERSRHVSIPECVRTSGKQIVAAYLRALFEGDGHVDKRGHIKYTSQSKKLIDEIQILLLNFGIFSTYAGHWYTATNGKPGNRSFAYVLQINGHESNDLFMREIGFVSARKSERVRKNYQNNVPYITDTLTALQKKVLVELFNKISTHVSQYKTLEKRGDLVTLRSLGLRLDRLNKHDFELSRTMATTYVNKLLEWKGAYLIPSQLFGELVSHQRELEKRKYYSPVKSIIKSNKKKVTYDFEIPGVHRFMANGILNHNSSKTSSMILWDGYNLHHMLKVPSPQAVFGVLSTQVLTATYTALTFGQAITNIWNPYQNALKTIPWFVNYHKFLDKRGRELGEELYNIGEHMVRYRHRNLILAPSGPSKRTLRGATRYSSAMDEAGYFPITKVSGKNGEEFERLDAKGVFDALNNSLFTVKAAHRRRVEEGFNFLPKPMMFAISSPSKYNDFIMSSYRLYQNSTEFFSYKLPTWDYNPLLKKKDFKEEFRVRPVEAARDYECNPPIGENLFITDHGSLQKAFRSGPNKIQTIAKKGLSKTKSPITNAEVRVTTNSFPLRGTVLSVDIGIVNNSLSFSIIGLPDDYDSEILPEDRGTMQTPVKVWAVGEVIPKAGTKINLTSVYTECFIPLIEPFNVMYMVSDRWQHAKIASDLEESYEVIPLEHKASWSDFEATRDLLYSGNLILPRLQEPFDDILKTTLDNYPEVFRNRPIDHLAWQFATVRESTNVTVLKGDGGTDDSFRTIVLGVAQVQDPEIAEELMKVNNIQATRKPFASMILKYSSGGFKAGNQVHTGQNGALAMAYKLKR